MKRGRPYVAVSQSQQRIVAAKQRLYRIQIILEDQPLGTHPSHICQDAFCNPQNEPDLIHLGALPGPPLTTNVWVCNRGTTHVCTPQHCQLQQASRTGEMVCPLSGMVHGVDRRPEQKSDPDWTPHWAPLSKAEQKQFQKRHKTTPTAKPEYASIIEERAANVKRNLPKRRDVTQRAKQTVAKLLYSMVRKRQNDIYRQRCRVRADRAIQAYCLRQKQRNQLPRIPVMMELISNAWIDDLPFAELERDENRIQLYGTIVTQVWDRVLDFMLTPWEAGGERMMLFTQGIRPSADQVILGTLYMMREGYAPNGISLLPQDPYLAHYLPWQKDLHLFGIKKRDISPGKNLLRSMYNRALECNVPVHVLRLDYNALQRFGYGVHQGMINGESLSEEEEEESYDKEDDI